MRALTQPGSDERAPVNLGTLRKDNARGAVLRGVEGVIRWRQSMRRGEERRGASLLLAVSVARLISDANAAPLCREAIRKILVPVEREWMEAGWREGGGGRKESN